MEKTVPKRGQRAQRMWIQALFSLRFLGAQRLILGLQAKCRPPNLEGKRSGGSSAKSGRRSPQSKAHAIRQSGVRPLLHRQARCVCRDEEREREMASRFLSTYGRAGLVSLNRGFVWLLGKSHFRRRRAWIRYPVRVWR